MHAHSFAGLGIEPGLGDDLESDFLNELIETQRDVAAVELDPQVIMHRVAERTQKLTGADGASVQLLQGDDLVCRAVSGLMTPHDGFRFAVNTSLTGYAVRTRHFQWCRDTERDDRVEASSSRMMGVRSMVVVPLVFGDDALGVMSVVSRRVDAFETRHVSGLRLMAGLVAAALAHAAEMQAKKQLLAERGAALASLGESEAAYRSTFELAGCGMVHVDLSTGRFLRVNRKVCEILGYSADELLTLSFHDISHPDDLAACKESAGNMATGKLTHYSTCKRYLRKDEATIWVSLHATTVRSSNGELLYGVGMINDITEQRRAEQALRSSEGQFRALASHAPVAIFQTDANGDNLYVNDRWTMMTGMSAAEAAGRGWINAVHPDDRERVLKGWHDSAGKRDEFHGEHRYVTRHGAVRWVHGAAVPMHDDEGALVGYLGTATDLTERKRTEWLEGDRREVLELVAQDRPLRDVLDRVVYLLERQAEGCGIALLVLEDGEISLHARSLAADLKAAVCKRPLPLASSLASSVWHEPLGVGVTNVVTDPAWRDAADAIASSGFGMCWTTPIRGSDDTPLGLITLFRDSGRRPSDAEAEMLSMVGRLASIAIEHHQTTKRLAHLVRHDPLTALPNRILFEDRVLQAIAISKRSGNPLAVMVLDIDHFKNINDTLGHDAGDHLLQQFARRARSRLREADTMARLGGDEFVIVLPELDNRENAAVVAQKLVDCMAEPFALSNQQVAATCSIGIAMFPDDAQDAAVLQKKADEALYRVKRRGRNGFAF